MEDNNLIEFNDELNLIITELMEENNIAKLDIIWLFSYTLNKFSIDRYLNNKQNIFKLLKKIATQLLILRHGVGNSTTALGLFGDIKVRVIDRFDGIIKKRKELFALLRSDLSDLIRNETTDIMIQFTKNKLHRNLDLVSFLSIS